jgi:dihydroneopterin aldolase / 2-amino-4-hydroxy-6-hydroxymethyldihydropteridine diphosphokinase
MSDKIFLKGVSGVGYHGVFEHEKREGQTFVVDVEVTSDFSAAVKSDDVRDTVNYAELADIAYEAITGQPFDLIEKLADVIARDCLDISGVTAVTVTVHKPNAPIAVPFENVSVSRSLP